jgi:hypothetical protein
VGIKDCPRFSGQLFALKEPQKTTENGARPSENPEYFNLISM